MTEGPGWPAGWDAHVHVFADDAPVLAGHYRPVARSLAEIEQVGAAEGVGHLVLVQPSVYGTDNRVLLDALRREPGRHRAVVVVEAAAKSGSLITAKSALDYGREVMAVPGHPFDARASGCNMLIRDGAVLVRGAADVLEALGAADRARPGPQECMPVLPGPEAPPRALKEVAVLHSMILSRLGPSPLAEDQLLRDLNVAPTDLAPELLTLELDGRIARQPGGLLTLVN